MYETEYLFMNKEIMKSFAFTTNYLNVAAAYMNILAHLLKFVPIGKLKKKVSSHHEAELSIDATLKNS